MPSAEEKLVAFLGRPAPGRAPPRVERFDFFGISNTPCQTSRWEPAMTFKKSIRNQMAQPLGIEPSQMVLETFSPPWNIGLLKWFPDPRRPVAFTSQGLVPGLLHVHWPERGLAGIRSENQTDQRRVLKSGEVPSWRPIMVPSAFSGTSPFSLRTSMTASR